MISSLSPPSRHSKIRLRVLAKNDAPRWSRRQLGMCLLGCLLAFGLPQSALAQAEPGEAVINREYPLKALFLYNFGGYIAWPAEAFRSAEQPFVIGILGSAPLEDTLREISATKKIGGRRIAVQHFVTVDAIKPCQILFIARDVSPQNQRLVVEKLRQQPVLVVGESEGFAGRGGSVNFFIESNKIRFEINIDAAKQQQLKISSKLLALARIVQQRDAASR